jgi:hypothetical protein
VDSFRRNWRKDFPNKDKSILWARDINTISGSAFAGILMRASEDSPTNTGGLSFAFSPEQPLRLLAACDAILWFPVDTVCDL